MTTNQYATGNSKTLIAFQDDWLVLDIGSGHNPHPRANVLADRFFEDDAERTGKGIVLDEAKPFVIADACAMPFKDGAFDYLVCSHVAEHIDDVPAFCAELQRVSKAGYVETPSKFTELIRHPPNHRWFVSSKGSLLRFEKAPVDNPLGALGKLFFSLYFYGTRQVANRNVYAFADGVGQPLHFFLENLRGGLRLLWRLGKAVTYTRFRWQGKFQWQISD